MFGSITKFGVIPRGPMNTVSYTALLIFFSSRHAVLGIQPGKLGAWIFARQGVFGLYGGQVASEFISRSAVVAKSIGDMRAHVYMKKWDDTAGTVSFVVQNEFYDTIDTLRLKYGASLGNTATLTYTGPGTYTFTITTGLGVSGALRTELAGMQGAANAISEEFWFAGAAWTPAYFANSLDYWWDFTDTAQLYSDTARTTHPAAAGDVVLSVTDGSAHAGHQSSTYGQLVGGNPTYQIDADGKPCVNFPYDSAFASETYLAAPGTGPLSICMGVFPATSLEDNGCLLGLGDGSGPCINFYQSLYGTPNTAIGNFWGFMSLGTGAYAKHIITSFNTTLNATMTGRLRDTIVPRVTDSPQYFGSVGGGRLRIMSYAENANTRNGAGKVYAVFCSLRTLTATEQDLIVNWVRNKMGL